MLGREGFAKAPGWVPGTRARASNRIKTFIGLVTREEGTGNGKGRIISGILGSVFLWDQLVLLQERKEVEILPSCFGQVEEPTESVFSCRVFDFCDLK